MTATGRRKLTEPLESVTAFFGFLILFALLAAVGFTLFGNGSFGGFGFGSQPVCVTQPGATYGNSGWTISPGLGVAARPGGSISITGSLQTCAIHPTFAEHVLYMLTVFPAVVLWVGVLLLIWRIIRTAQRHGPFTPRVAAAMRHLAWFILIGSFAAALIQTAATDQLLNLTVRAPQLFVDVIWMPFRALVPVPALTWAALLTFARIIKLGVEMDDEIKGTV